jgi:oleate hydratase
MVRQQQDILARRHLTPNNVNAWILGSSFASLASAVHLISDANVPASQIHILESRSTPGDGITSTGDPMCGYDHRPGCLPNFSDGCLEKLLALVPSTTSPRTVLKDVENFQHDDACRDVPITHVLIQGDHGPKKMETRKLGLTLKDRMKLTMFLLRSEKSLARKRINQLFNEPFFDSMFWTVFSTLWAARLKKARRSHKC